jgi:hypothetical protein
LAETFESTSITDSKFNGNLNINSNLSSGHSASGDYSSGLYGPEAVELLGSFGANNQDDNFSIIGNIYATKN